MAFRWQAPSRWPPSVPHPLERWLPSGRGRRWRRPVALLAATALLLMGLWAAVRGGMPYDFRIFRRAGVAVLDRRPTYPHLPLTEAVRHHHPFVYPLAAAWLFAPLARRSTPSACP